MATKLIVDESELANVLYCMEQYDTKPALECLRGLIEDSPEAPKELNVGHYFHDNTATPLTARQADHGVEIALPMTGWELFIEINDDGKPVICTYRPESQEEPVHKLVLEEP